MDCLTRLGHGIEIKVRTDLARNKQFLRLRLTLCCLVSSAIQCMNITLYLIASQAIGANNHPMGLEQFDV
jgi:hypothetical protein